MSNVHVYDVSIAPGSEHKSVIRVKRTCFAVLNVKYPVNVMVFI